MDLEEARDTASTIASLLDDDAMGAVEQTGGPIAELEPFLNELHGVLNSDQSGTAVQLHSELTEKYNAVRNILGQAHETASALAGCISSMRDRL